MKKIFLIAVIASFSFSAFATHYIQKGNTNEAKSNYLIYKERLMKLPKVEMKAFYDFYSDCSGLKQKESSLVQSGKAEFVGASGVTHKIADIFSTYEKRALAMGERDFAFSTNHDKDVFVVFNQTGKNYTIDIYTGKDALSAREAASKK